MPGAISSNNALFVRKQLNLLKYLSGSSTVEIAGAGSGGSIPVVRNVLHFVDNNLQLQNQDLSLGVQE